MRFLLELQTQLPIRGRIWCLNSSLSAVEHFGDLWLKQWPGIVPPVKPASVVFQHVRGVEKIVILTAQVMMVGGGVEEVHFKIVYP